MNTFNKEKLLEGFNVDKYENKFEIDNGKVLIVIENNSKNEDDTKLDLVKFYSRVNTPGYARCSLYFMLKEIIEKISKYNNESEIQISIIAPSEPRRDMKSIKKTYNNIGFKNINCYMSKALTDQEYENLVSEYPFLNDTREMFSKDTEICSAGFEKIQNILDHLKNCETNKRNRNFTDKELLDYTPDPNYSPIFSYHELVNYSSDSDNSDDQENVKKKKKGGKTRKKKVYKKKYLKSKKTYRIK